MLLGLKPSWSLLFNDASQLNLDLEILIDKRLKLLNWVHINNHTRSDNNLNNKERESFGRSKPTWSPELNHPALQHSTHQQSINEVKTAELTMLCSSIQTKYNMPSWKIKFEQETSHRSMKTAAESETNTRVLKFIRK